MHGIAPILEAETAPGNGGAIGDWALNEGRGSSGLVPSPDVAVPGAIVMSPTSSWGVNSTHLGSLDPTSIT